MSGASDGSVKSPLDAAQKIVAELNGMTSDHQLLALKFATETLGLRLSSVSPQVVTPSASSLQQALPQVPTGADHSTDIRAFTAMKAPKSDQQFTAVCPSSKHLAQRAARFSGERASFVG
ncbi:hypothetical protein [Nitrobacter sp. TKz-YC02]|uniref:hypothetical protein n=1 Tax=Nitrobacter sp. TKz-YC02 TaxID=3398704 RepID=UPI003CF4CACE